jgi:uncharacterized protein (TIGR00369 family)
VHTHYDGQATWDAQLAPSSVHGVTTAVFGNCGVGFAPLRAGAIDFLINLMEGVEDIPGTVLAEGIPFGWESFPEYLDALERLPHAIDIGAQVPHAALRCYVMGERGGDHAEHPTAGERDEMARLLEEALAAGALGLSTSRTVKHRAKDGRPTPSLSAREDELFALAAAMGDVLAIGAGCGVTRREQLVGLSGMQMMQKMLAGEFPYPPIGQTLDFTLIELGPGMAVFQGTPKAAHLNPLGTVHGGWYATLLDSAVGCAVHTTMPAGRAYTTAELSLNIVRAAWPDREPLRAIGQVLHTGKQLATAEGRIVDAAGRLYAHATTTCLVFEVPGAQA